MTPCGARGGGPARRLGPWLAALLWAAGGALAQEAPLVLESEDETLGLYAWDVATVRDVTDPAGRPAVEVELTDEAAGRLAAFSVAHAERRIEVRFCGEAVMRARLGEPLLQGRFAIIGGDDARRALVATILRGERDCPAVAS